MTVEYDKRDWGFDTDIIDTKLYSSRVLIVLEGQSLPYFYHKKRDKTLFILQGVVKLVIEGKSKFLQEGETYHILPKIRHQIVAFKGDATIIEVGTPLQDDIVIVEE